MNLWLMLSTEPDVGFHLMTPKSQPEQKPRAGCLTDCTTQVPSEVSTIIFPFHRGRNQGTKPLRNPSKSLNY